jgi:hypothetical protein
MQQKDEPCPPDIVAKADAIVRKMRDAAIAGASELNALGIHKQYCNRYLEPFGHIAVVLTATDFDNFFTLRSHPAALPDIQILSDKMLEAYVSSTPVARMAHLPFLNTEELTDDYTLNAKRSSARCARVSYLNHEGKVPTLEEDMKLYDRLMAEVPRHSSPTEHIARVLDPVHGGLRADAYSGNIRGWHQFRKSIVDECIRSTDLGALLARPNRPHERAAV